MKRWLIKKTDSLENLYRLVDSFCKRHILDDRTSFALNLVAEELFTNILKYTPESNRDILVNLVLKKEQIILELTAFDVEKFDITQQPEVNINLSLEDRKTGGLGLHLVRQMVDEIHYEYQNRESKITLIKKREA